MVAPAVVAAAISAAPKVISAVKGLGSTLGGKIGNLGGMLKGGIGKIGSSGILGGAGNAAVDAARRAYFTHYLQGVGDDMANALEARAEKYDQKLQDMFNTAEPQYLNEANTQLPELQQLMSDIAQQNTETQRGDLRRINAVLAQQGVRGGQAAILANRAMGETSRDTLRDINQLAYNEAANRQNSRLNYYSQKALTPWQNMSSAYSQSMVGANNALSGAQGNIYQNAYDQMMRMKTGTDAATVARLGGKQ